MDYELHWWSRKPPPHLCYIAKRKDVDRCLERLGMKAPFQELWLGEISIPHELRSPKQLPESFEIAKAKLSYHVVRFESHDFRERTMALEIGLCPRELLTSVREPFFETGLPELLRWLDDLTRQPETALIQNLALHCVYDVATGTLRTWKGRTPAGTNNRSP